MKDYIYKENIENWQGVVGCEITKVPASIVKQIRADVIDEVISLARCEIDFESQAEQKRFVEFMERLKE